MESGRAGSGGAMRSWWEMLKRTGLAFRDDDLGDRAAALTYYGVLAIFPALIALVSVVGLVGESWTQPLLDNLGELAPGPANEIVTGAVNNITSSRGGAGVALVIGLAVAVVSASGYVGAFSRASNAIYGVEEGRPAWKRRPLQVAITLGMIMLLALSAIAVVISGPLANQLGDLVGAGEEAQAAWGIAKWPVIGFVVIALLSLLYRTAPDAELRGISRIAPGAVLALAVWILASLAFTLYVGNFASYNATYGAIAGVIVFLVWLWITNAAILLGAVLNAEVLRSRQAG